MEITAMRNTDRTTQSTSTTSVREQSSTPSILSTTVREQSSTPSILSTTVRDQSSTQATIPADKTSQSATTGDLSWTPTYLDELALNLSTSESLLTWDNESSLSTSSEFATFSAWQTEVSIAQNIGQKNAKASVRIRIIMIAAISSTSFILLLIFLGWIGIHYRRRQANRITRQKNTGGSRILPPLPYGHGDVPFESKDYSMNHTYNLPFSTSLDNIYESVPNQETPDPTKPSKAKKTKKRSKSKQVDHDLPSEVIQPSDDYATYADIPELLSAGTGHVTSSIAHADVHRLSTFASEKDHHVDQSAGQSLKVIDASGYLSPNVEISSNNLNLSLHGSSEDKGKQPFHTNTNAGITVDSTESAMLDDGEVSYERPDNIAEVDGRDASDVNGLISKPGNDEEAPYEVLEDSLISDIDTFNYLVATGIKSGDDDAGYAAVDDIGKSHTDNLGYEVPNDTVKEKDNDGYYEVTNDNLKYEEVPTLIANQSESDGLGYLVPNTHPKFQANLPKATTLTEGEPNDDNETGAIRHTYIDCGNSVVEVGSHPANNSIDPRGTDDKYSVIPEGSGGLITVIHSNDTVGKIPHQIDESKIDALGYLVPRVTKVSQKNSAKPKIDKDESSDEIIHHTYLDCNDSMLVERDYSEITNDVGKDSPLGPRHSGKAPNATNTPDQNDSSIDRKLSVCRKVTDETYPPRLQHTYHGLEELTLKQSQDKSFQHQTDQTSGGQKNKLQISQDSGIPSGKEQDNGGNANLDIHGYMVLDETHM